MPNPNHPLQSSSQPSPCQTQSDLRLCFFLRITSLHLHQYSTTHRISSSRTTYYFRKLNQPHTLSATSYHAIIINVITHYLLWANLARVPPPLFLPATTFSSSTPSPSHYLPQQTQPSLTTPTTPTPSPSIQPSPSKPSLTVTPSRKPPSTTIVPFHLVTIPTCEKR